MKFKHSLIFIFTIIFSSNAEFVLNIDVKSIFFETDSVGMRRKKNAVLKISNNSASTSCNILLQKRMRAEKK